MIDTTTEAKATTTEKEANVKIDDSGPDSGAPFMFPKTLKENLRFRAKLLMRAKEDQKLQAVIKQKVESDILFFFNVCLWTPDPRSALKNLPFITYQFQDKYLNWLEEKYQKQEDGLTEKSRDMGASMMVIGWMLWHWIRDKGFNALLGSYIEDLVDNGTIDSHFGRFEYMLNRLPAFLLPDGYNPRVHRSSMKLYNPENGSLLVGYAPTERFSRAGRYAVIFADEFAFWKHARAAWIAMGDASKCRLVTSTPNGKGNKFADLALKSHIDKKVLHWREHPMKDDSWYEAERRRRTEEEIAQELDINYNKSVLGRVYPEFDEWNFKDFQEYNPQERLFVAWDFGLGDETAMIWLQTNSKTGAVRIIDAYQNAGKTIDFYVPFVTGEAISHKVYKYTNADLELIAKHKGWQAATHYGDPTGDNKHQSSGTSVIQQLKIAGILVNINRKMFGISDRIQKTKLLIRRLSVDSRLNDFIDAIQNARFPNRTDLSQSTSDNAKPVHDWTSHYRTALEYYAVNENLKQIANVGKIVHEVKRRANAFDDRLKEFLGRKQNKNGANYRRCV